MISMDTLSNKDVSLDRNTTALDPMDVRQPSDGWMFVDDTVSKIAEPLFWAAWKVA